MIKKRYEEEIDRYTVSPELLAKTQKIMEETKQGKAAPESKVRNKKPPIVWGARILAVTAAIAIVSIVIFRYEQPITVISTIESGAHLTSVELSHGALHFDKESSIRIPSQKKLASLDQKTENTGARKYFEKEFILPVSNKEFREIGALFTINTDENGEQTAVSYNYRFLSLEDGGEIYIAAKREEDSSLTAPNSAIGNVPVFLSWGPQQQAYSCEFRKGNITYTITSKQMEQKQFIQFLILFLSE